MKRLIMILLLITTFTASAGVFNSQLYRYANKEDVVTIVYLDGVAHCAVLAISVPKAYQKTFDGEAFVGTVGDSVSILAKSNMDQVPNYKSIVDTYNKLPSDSPLRVTGSEIIGQLSAFLKKGDDKIEYITVNGTINDVTEEIKDRVAGASLNGTFSAYENAAYDLYMDESCPFLLGEYYKEYK